MQTKSETNKRKGKTASVVNLKVRRSGAGLGLYTNEDIKSGRFIIEYTGEKITQEEANRRGGRYLFDLNKRWVIDGKNRANTARYINHSCRPNCETDEVKGTIKVYARRKIKAGEELCYDYGKSYFNDHIKPVGCKCLKCKEKKRVRGK